MFEIGLNTPGSQPAREKLAIMHQHLTRVTGMRKKRLRVSTHSPCPLVRLPAPAYIGKRDNFSFLPRRALLNPSAAQAALTSQFPTGVGELGSPSMEPELRKGPTSGPSPPPCTAAVAALLERSAVASG